MSKTLYSVSHMVSDGIGYTRTRSLVFAETPEKAMSILEQEHPDHHHFYPEGPDGYISRGNAPWESERLVVEKAKYFGEMI